jgi:antirestriction protein
LTTKPRIYVACLAAYNSGKLHGRWLVANRPPEEIYDDIQDMLRHSPLPGAEEWAIHDYEGFCGLSLGEYEDIEEVAGLATHIEKHGEAMAHYVNDRGLHYVDMATLEEDFEEAFAGQYESTRAFAEAIVGELGFGGLAPDQLEGIWSFIDWDHLAHELTITDYWSVDAHELGGGVFVFRRN